MKKVFYVIVVAALMGFSCSEKTEKSAATDNKQEVSTETTDENVEIQEDATEASAVSTASVSPNNGGKVVKLTNKEFLELIWDYKANPNTWVYKGDKPVIIDFYADWCGPCKRVAPIMDELAKEHADQVNIYKIDTDVERELASIFSIRSIPSMLFIPVNGQPAMHTGAYPKAEYQKLMSQYFANI